MKASFPVVFPFIVLLFASGFASCDLINPEEQIPSFIHIDSISLATTSGEGTPDHNIVDAWVFENEKMVGVYELPATVPILKNGDADIRIRAGIKLNGQVGTRVPYIFTEDFRGTVELFPDSQVQLNPTVSFHDWVSFDWLEDLEGTGLSLSTTDANEGTLERLDGEEAFSGRSLKLSLGEDEWIFECRTTTTYDLPGGGAPVFLELRYRCNHSFVVGLFSRDPGGEFQIPIIVLNPSEEWNRIYVNLTDIVSSNAGFLDHRPFFGFIRDEDHVGEAYVYLDNIRMLH